MCSKESNINSNSNENSIAICSMFTHLKTITVQCEIGNGIFIPHLTRLYRPYTLDCFYSHQFQRYTKMGETRSSVHTPDNLHCERGA